MRRLILFGFVLLAVSVRVKADPVTIPPAHRHLAAGPDQGSGIGTGALPL